MKLGIWLFGKIAEYYLAISLTFVAGLGGSISVWFASRSEWVSQYGVLGWWIAALFGAGAFVLIILGAVGVASYIQKILYMRQWAKKVDFVNPLENEFSKERIKLEDFVNPITRTIVGKTFIDCELLGPSNILIANNNTFDHSGFINCDFIEIRENLEGARTVILFIGCRIIRSKMYECAFFIHPSIKKNFIALGGVFITK
jgi:hypothetical protein